MRLDVKAYVNKEKQKLKQKIDQLVEKPTLAIYSLEEDTASDSYMKNKLKLAEELGIYAFIHKYNYAVQVEEALADLQESGHGDTYDGIIVQIPANKTLQYVLPNTANKKLSYLDIINTYIDSSKDVDGLSDSAMTHLYRAGNSMQSMLEHIDNSGSVPCTAAGIINYLRYLSEKDSNNQWQYASKHAVIIGRSDLVGKPLSIMLNALNCTTTLCHSYTNGLKHITKQADLVISAIGKPRFFDCTYFNDFQTLIDVGISRLNGKLYGDIDTEDVELFTKVTPVPGGVGLLTTLQLMKNTYIKAAAKAINKL